MRISEVLTEDAARVTSQELVKLLGKGRTNALVRHPWFKDYSNWEKAFRYDKDQYGSITIDMFPYYPKLNMTPDGKIRPTVYVSFIFAIYSPKIIQAHRFVRPQEPDEHEIHGRITGGWRHNDSWKEEK